MFEPAPLFQNPISSSPLYPPIPYSASSLFPSEATHANRLVYSCHEKEIPGLLVAPGRVPGANLIPRARRAHSHHPE